MKDKDTRIKITMEREEDLKQMIKNNMLIEDYDEWNSLLETIELRHSIELEEAYEQGIGQAVKFIRSKQAKKSPVLLNLGNLGLFLFTYLNFAMFIFVLLNILKQNIFNKICK